MQQRTGNHSKSISKSKIHLVCILNMVIVQIPDKNQRVIAIVSTMWAFPFLANLAQLNTKSYVAYMLTYPLVSFNITMKNDHLIAGKNHELSMAMFQQQTVRVNEIYSQLETCVCFFFIALNYNSMKHGYFGWFGLLFIQVTCCSSPIIMRYIETNQT